MGKYNLLPRSFIYHLYHLIDFLTITTITPSGYVKSTNMSKLKRWYFWHCGKAWEDWGRVEQCQKLSYFFCLSHPSTSTLSPFPAARVRWLAPSITWSGSTPIIVKTGAKSTKVSTKYHVMEKMEKGMVLLVLLTRAAYPPDFLFIFIFLFFWGGGRQKRILHIIKKSHETALTDS